MPNTLETVRTIAELRKRVTYWRTKNKTIALVPTMGALHEGHLSLVRLAGDRADVTIVSIFVNPAQFAPNEDFKTYPRDAKGDRKKITAAGADLIYMPDAHEMYPKGYATKVEVMGVSKGLCGDSRPHFFAGVATVVAKLLIQALPDFAVFGAKDYQQLLVIRRMVTDLNLPVEIIGGPIVREKDGLAMSSRNHYLTVEERLAAPKLFATITLMAQKLARDFDVDDVITAGKVALASAGFKVDYLEVRDAETLQPVTGKVEEPARVFAAASLGKTRLIDNVPVHH